MKSPEEKRLMYARLQALKAYRHELQGIIRTNDRIGKQLYNLNPAMGAAQYNAQLGHLAREAEQVYTDAFDLFDREDSAEQQYLIKRGRRR